MVSAVFILTVGIIGFAITSQAEKYCKQSNTQLLRQVWLINKEKLNHFTADILILIFTSSK